VRPMLSSGSWLSQAEAYSGKLWLIPVLLLTVHSNYVFVFLSSLGHEVREAVLWHIRISPEQPTYDASRSRSASRSSITDGFVCWHV